MTGEELNLILNWIQTLQIMHPNLEKNVTVQFLQNKHKKKTFLSDTWKDIHYIWHKGAVGLIRIWACIDMVGGGLQAWGRDRSFLKSC